MHCRLLNDFSASIHDMPVALAQLSHTEMSPDITSVPGEQNYLWLTTDLDKKGLDFVQGRWDGVEIMSSRESEMDF